MKTKTNPFAARLRALRESADLTQTALAEKARVEQCSLSRWEKGNRSMPDYAVLKRLAEALGVTLERLAEG